LAFAGVGWAPRPPMLIWILQESSTLLRG